MVSLTTECLRRMSRWSPWVKRIVTPQSNSQFPTKLFYNPIYNYRVVIQASQLVITRSGQTFQ